MAAALRGARAVSRRRPAGRRARRDARARRAERPASTRRSAVSSPTRGVDVLVVVGPGASPLAAARARARPGRGGRDPGRRGRARRGRAGMGAGDAVLVKGSRAVGLELVVRGLTRRAGGSAGDRAARRHGRRLHAEHPRHAAADPRPGAQQHRPADPRRRPVRASPRAEGGHADHGRHRDRRRGAGRVPRRAHPHRTAPLRPCRHHADGAHRRHGDRRLHRRLPRRAQGAQPRAAQAGQDRGRAGRRRPASRCSRSSTSACRPTSRSRARSTSTSVRGCGSCSRSR